MKIRAPFMMPDGGAASGGGEPTGTDPNGSSVTDPKAAGNGSKDGTGQKSQSFDDVLKENSAFQAELDRRINKAVEKATANERDRQKIIQDSLQDEVLRVSKMTQEEKDAYFRTKAEKEAQAKEANLVKRELTLDARTVLADKKLPDSFIDLLSYGDRESCMKSIDVLEAAFTKAVQEAVEERLKGSAPPKDAGSEGQPASPQSAKEEALAKMRKLAGVRAK